MALDTIPVVLSHDNIQQYLSKLDDRGEGYHFVVSGDSKRGRPVELELIRDGSNDGMTVELNPNGTWAARHFVVIGEQQ